MTRDQPGSRASSHSQTSRIDRALDHAHRLAPYLLAALMGCSASTPPTAGQTLPWNPDVECIAPSITPLSHAPGTSGIETVATVNTSTEQVGVAVLTRSNRQATSDEGPDSAFRLEVGWDADTWPVSVLGGGLSRAKWSEGGLAASGHLWLAATDAETCLDGVASLEVHFDEAIADEEPPQETCRPLPGPGLGNPRRLHAETPVRDWWTFRDWTHGSAPPSVIAEWDGVESTWTSHALPGSLAGTAQLTEPDLRWALAVNASDGLPPSVFMMDPKHADEEPILAWQGPTTHELTIHGLSAQNSDDGTALWVVGTTADAVVLYSLRPGDAPLSGLTADAERSLALPPDSQVLDVEVVQTPLGPMLWLKLSADRHASTPWVAQVGFADPFGPIDIQDPTMAACWPPEEVVGQLDLSAAPADLDQSGTTDWVGWASEGSAAIFWDIF